MYAPFEEKLFLRQIYFVMDKWNPGMVQVNFSETSIKTLETSNKVTVSPSDRDAITSALKNFFQRKTIMLGDTNLTPELNDIVGELKQKSVDAGLDFFHLSLNSSIISNNEIAAFGGFPTRSRIGAGEWNMKSYQKVTLTDCL